EFMCTVSSAHNLEIGVAFVCFGRRQLGPPRSGIEARSLALGCVFRRRVGGGHIGKDHLVSGPQTGANLDHLVEADLGGAPAGEAEFDLRSNGVLAIAIQPKNRSGLLRQFRKSVSRPTYVYDIRQRKDVDCYVDIQPSNRPLWWFAIQLYFDRS